MKEKKPKKKKNKKIISKHMVYGISWFEWDLDSGPSQDGYSFFLCDEDRQKVINEFKNDSSAERNDSISNIFEVDSERLYGRVLRSNRRYNTDNYKLDL